MREVLSRPANEIVDCKQGSFPMGTTGNGVPTLILAVGTPFPHLFEFRILNKTLDEFRDFVNREERNP